MIKAILFDTDGVVIKREKYFSQRLSDDFGIPTEKVMAFFRNEFQNCTIGKADLKKELPKYFNVWKWEKSTEALLDYWFGSESDVNREIVKIIENLRGKNIKCYLCTNNEKYRTEYLRDKLKLNKIFDAIFSSSEVGYLKENKNFWKVIYNNLPKLSKSDILVVDDDQKNIDSAKEFGFSGQLYTDLKSLKSRIENENDKN